MTARKSPNFPGSIRTYTLIIKQLHMSVFVVIILLHDGWQKGSSGW